MSKEMWSQLNRFEDGDNLNAETLNIPIGQLGDRTEFLYSRLSSLISGDKLSSVVLTGVGLNTDDEPDVGNVVYLDRNTGLFAKAKATMSLYDDFKAADSAFTIGVLSYKDDGKGDVVIYGSVNLSPNGTRTPVSQVVESGEKFRSGRYYLSSSEAGHVTSEPSGPLIYAFTASGSVDATGGIDGVAIVTPQFLDIGTSHVHRTAVLRARPAGTNSTKGYLPIDEDSPFALRFGGTWTSDSKVNYSFFLEGDSQDWSQAGGVKLCWRENGGSMKWVKIPAPDAEVAISNGLTARLSISDSQSDKAYSGITDSNKRTWSTLTFPDAGMGWLDHEPVAVAESESVAGLRVAVKGKFMQGASTVNVAFPGTVNVYSLGNIVGKTTESSSGTKVTYGGTTYEFTYDRDRDSGDAFIPMGTCPADSLLYLAQRIHSSGAAGRIAVLEKQSSSRCGDAFLVVMDGGALEIDGVPAVPVEDASGSYFDVGATNVPAVVFDGNLVVLTDTAVVALDSYSWTNYSGGVSVMLYKDHYDTVTVPAGTLASATAVDEEPDAVYDYVLGMDQMVAKFWPPVPPKSAALLVNGVEMDNKALVPDHPTVSFSRDTIHWFEDDEGRRPWPEGIASLVDGESIDPSNDKVEIMHWVRGFQGSTGPVTSLQVKPGSPLKIYGYGTSDNANVGDLEIAADFDFKVENGGAAGFNVPKRASNGRLIAGPVVERIVGGAGVNIISKAGCPNGQGTVVVALENGAYGNQFSDIALENADQAKIGMFPYIRLKGYSGNVITHPSAFTATVRVPTNLPDMEYALRIRASVFGENGFSGESSQKSACIKFSYNILPDFSATGNLKYSNLKSSLQKPDVERSVLIPFGHSGDGGIVYNGFDPILITTDDAGMEEQSDVVEKVLGGDIPSSSEFAMQDIAPSLRPGYLVGIRISRDIASGYGVTPYTDPIGFINLSWSLVENQDGWRGATNPVRPLDGVQIRANTPAGIRSAVETMGERLGATVVRSVGR